MLEATTDQFICFFFNGGLTCRGQEETNKIDDTDTNTGPIFIQAVLACLVVTWVSTSNWYDLFIL